MPKDNTAIVVDGGKSVEDYCRQEACNYFSSSDERKDELAWSCGNVIMDSLESGETVPGGTCLIETRRQFTAIEVNPERGDEDA